MCNLTSTLNEVNSLGQCSEHWTAEEMSECALTGVWTGREAVWTQRQVAKIRCIEHSSPGP